MWRATVLGLLAIAPLACSGLLGIADEVNYATDAGGNDGPTAGDAPSPDDGGADVETPDGTPSDANPGSDGGTASDAGAVDCGVRDGQPEVLASGQNLPAGLVLDSQNIYWTATGPGGLFECSLAGCGGLGPTSLATGLTGLQGLAIWAPTSTLYFSQDETSGAVFAESTSVGGNPVTLAAATSPTLVATDGTAIYFADENGDILACAPNGCNGNAPTTISTGNPSVGGIVASGGLVYWADGNGIHSMLPDGGLAVTLSSTGAVDLAVDTTRIYFLTVSEVVEECELASGCVAVTTLAQNQPNVQNIAVDSTNVYWTAQGGGNGVGQVFECAIGGCDGGPTSLAQNLDAPTTVAADPDACGYVYWVNADVDAALQRVSK